MYPFDAVLLPMFGPRSTLPVLSSEPSSTAGVVAWNTSERDLWVRVATGEAAALRDIYRAHHQSVRAFAQRLLGDVQSAEDLVQDVFLALPKAARNFRFETSGCSYLLGIAANGAGKHIRASKRRRAATERSLLEQTVSASLPDEQLHAARLIGQLMCAVDKLPDKLRLVFVLCQIEERDATEVGSILELPPPTVRARLKAARERIQSQNAWYSAKEFL